MWSRIIFRVPQLSRFQSNDSLNSRGRLVYSIIKMVGHSSTTIPSHLFADKGLPASRYYGNECSAEMRRCARQNPRENWNNNMYCVQTNKCPCFFQFSPFAVAVSEEEGSYSTPLAPTINKRVPWWISSRAEPRGELFFKFCRHVCWKKYFLI